MSSSTLYEITRVINSENLETDIFYNIISESLEIIYKREGSPADEEYIYCTACKVLNQYSNIQLSILPDVFNSNVNPFIYSGSIYNKSYYLRNGRDGIEVDENKKTFLYIRIINDNFINTNLQ